MSSRAAFLQTSFWITVSLLFGLIIWHFYDPSDPTITNHDAAMQYYTAYLTEYALSVDNIFVIIIILRYFQVDEKYHHKILFWGILGALVMRGLFIFLGALIIREFHFILYIFGGFLIYTGVGMLTHDEDQKIDLDNSSVVKFARKYLNFTNNDHGGKFFVRDQLGKLLFTPLFLVVILIETTDLIFAVDSIPAAFAITQDEVILYTSNIFAIMGLRAMFFLLANILDKFYLLKKGLALVLMFIGVKMMVEIFKHFDSLSFLYFKIPTWLSLIIIITLLAGSIVLSLISVEKKSKVQV